MGTDIGKERQKIHVNYQMGSHGGGGGRLNCIEKGWENSIKHKS